jgi:hypothetical protein
LPCIALPCLCLDSLWTLFSGWQVNKLHFCLTMAVCSLHALQYVHSTYNNTSNIVHSANLMHGIQLLLLSP